MLDIELENSFNKIHKSSNLSNKLCLLRKLNRAKLDEGGNMKTYILKILEIVDLCNRRLEHRYPNAIKQLISRLLAKGTRIDFCKHEPTCEKYIQAELTDVRYPKSIGYRARKYLEIVQSDLGRRI